MDLNRLRQLAGFKTLNENVSNDPALNAEIEKRLERVRKLGFIQRDKVSETAILDALDVLHRGGPDGISVSEWAEGVKALHPEIPLKALFTLVVKEFDCCVSRVGDKRYAFVETRANEAGIDDIDPNVKNSITMQVGLTYDAMEAMAEKEAFTREDLKSYLSGRGMSPQMADGFADHLLQHFGAESIGGGRFRIPHDEPTSNDKTMDFLRSIASDPTKHKF